MTKNPLINALSASSYIVLVAMLMFYGTRLLGPDDTIMAPIAMVSLFTLSAAVMGSVFLLKPVQLFLDGKKKVAVDLLTQTILYFAVITVLAFILLFTGVFK